MLQHSTFLVQVATSELKLPAKSYQISLHHCLWFCFVTRVAQWWRKLQVNQTNQLSGYQASAAIEICTILYASAQYIWEFCRCIQAFRVGPEAAYPPDYTMFAEKTESGMAISFQVNSISLEFYCFSQTREIVNCSAGQNTSSEISS